jgi:hypothetical protein
MKASEMIKALQEAIDRHGDGNVVSGIEMGYVFMVTGSEDDVELVCVEVLIVPMIKDSPILGRGPVY